MASEAATDTRQLSFDDQLRNARHRDVAKQPTVFAGLSVIQIAGRLLILAGLIWGMWATRELVSLRQHKVVSVRLGELVNQFALAEARSGDEPDKVTARTRAFMAALDHALKARAQNGQVVLVGEAVVASSGEDITAAVASAVAREVSMPVAQALPPRQPVAPVMSGSSGSAGVAQAMQGAFGTAGAQVLGPNGSSGPLGYGDPGVRGRDQQGFGKQDAPGPTEQQGGSDGQP